MPNITEVIVVIMVMQNVGGLSLDALTYAKHQPFPRYREAEMAEILLNEAPRCESHG